MYLADDGKGVVLSLLKARQGSSCRRVGAFLHHFLPITYLLFFQGEGSGEGEVVRDFR